MRLTHITTRTGDRGTSRLADGSERAKDDARFEAIGTVDELNAVLGVLVEALPDTDRPIEGERAGDGADAMPLPDSDLAESRAALVAIQSRLFDLGAVLAWPGGPVAFHPRWTAALEALSTRWNDDLPPLREFVLPGGNPSAAACHVARTVARRAERRCVTLARLEPGSVPDAALVWLNRLSDLLFVLARRLARRDGGVERCWAPAQD